MRQKKTKNRLSEDAFFTIVTPSYFAHAKSLMQSVQAHNPDQKRYVVVIGEGLKSSQLKKCPFEIIHFRDLVQKNENLLNLAFRYTAFQLCCALKPYVAEVLIEDYNIHKIIYLDSDIRAYSSFEESFSLLDRHPIVLTPHLLDPESNLNDGLQPNEGTILVAGTFNMGFFAVNNSEKGRLFLKWWRQRTFFSCERNPSKGLGDDQKWVDLIAGLFPEAHILQHFGYNVAYWNLHERALKEKDSRWFCRDQELVFYHYSGWTLQSPTVLSNHQNRYSFATHPELEKIYVDYAGALLKNGAAQIHSLLYEYNVFSNQLPITALLRKFYGRAENESVANFGNPFDAQREGGFFRWLTDPGPECVTPLALALRANRADVMESHPYPSGKEGNFRIQLWSSDFGLKEMGWSKAWQKVGEIATARAKGQLLMEAHLRQDQFKQPQPPALGFGVNLIGFLGSEKGMGTSARRSADCLAKAGIPFKECPVLDARSENVYQSKQAHAVQADYNINLIHINPNDLEHFRNTTHQPVLKSRINIGYWVWELSEFPQKFSRWFEMFDEIWVPSTFAQEAISKISPIPVVLVPHHIGENWPRLEVVEKNRPFTVLVTFDFDSGYERKNPEAAIDAFQKAFPSSIPNVRLIIKTMRAHRHVAEEKRLRSKVAKDSRIEWIDAVFTDRQSKELMQNCDCYLSLHRSEGFGLSILEALYLAKPVVATDYSGNRDFLNEETGYPVPYKSLRLQKDHGPYPKGAQWADPNIEEAADRLRSIFENRKEAEEKSKRGSQNIQTHFSAQAVSEIYRRRLAVLRMRTPRNV